MPWYSIKLYKNDEKRRKSRNFDTVFHGIPRSKKYCENHRFKRLKPCRKRNWVTAKPSETCRRFEVNSRDRIKSWDRIYLEEGPEGFAVERRGRGSKGRPKKLPKDVEEDLLAEVQRLRAENDYLKNLQALVLEDERRQRRKRW